MAKEYEIEIKGLKSLKAAMAKAPVTVKSGLLKAVKASAGMVYSTMRREAPKDTGKLRRNIHQNINSATISARIGPDLAATPYALYVHEGTRPHFPPVNAIQPWAEKRGIQPYALAKHIAREGTQANPYVERTYNQTKEDVKRVFSKRVRQIVSEIAENADGSGAAVSGGGISPQPLDMAAGGGGADLLF